MTSFQIFPPSWIVLNFFPGSWEHRSKQRIANFKGSYQQKKLTDWIRSLSLTSYLFRLPLTSSALTSSSFLSSTQLQPFFPQTFPSLPSFLPSFLHSFISSSLSSLLPPITLPCSFVSLLGSILSPLIFPVPLATFQSNILYSSFTCTSTLQLHWGLQMSCLTRILFAIHTWGHIHILFT